jgi:hypothetical protein
MQTARMLQAVLLMIIVAMAASCATSKEYTSKLFAPRITVIKDSQATAIHFLELDQLDANKDSWVKTDIVDNKDSTQDIAVLHDQSDSIPIIAKAVPDSLPIKKITIQNEPVAKSNNPNAIRTKKTRD